MSWKDKYFILRKYNNKTYIFYESFTVFLRCLHAIIDFNWTNDSNLMLKMFNKLKKTGNFAIYNHRFTRNNAEYPETVWKYYDMLDKHYNNITANLIQHCLSSGIKIASRIWSCWVVTTQSSHHSFDILSVRNASSSFNKNFLDYFFFFVTE